MSEAAIGPQPQALSDERAGRACYRAFTEAMAEWAPLTPEWENLPQHLRNGWIEGAKAVHRLP
jgi:hypothetical protein